MANPKYDDDFKIKVLEHTRANGYQWGKTAKKFRISVNTVKSWHKNHSHLVPEIYIPEEKILDKIATTRLNELKNIRGQAENVAKFALQRLEKSLMDKNMKISPSQLANIFSKIAPFIMPKFDEKEGDGKTLEDLTIDFVQESFDELNNIHNEKKPTDTNTVNRKERTSGKR
jgi:hypothetical protein